MTETRHKLNKIGLDYHLIAKFFSFKNSASFASSSKRKEYEEGVLRVIEYINQNIPPKHPI